MAPAVIGPSGALRAAPESRRINGTAVRPESRSDQGPTRPQAFPQRAERRRRRSRNRRARAVSPRAPSARRRRTRCDSPRATSRRRSRLRCSRFGARRQSGLAPAPPGPSASTSTATDWQRVYPDSPRPREGHRSGSAPQQARLARSAIGLEGDVQPARNRARRSDSARAGARLPSDRSRQHQDDVATDSRTRDRGAPWRATDCSAPPSSRRRDRGSSIPAGVSSTRTS